MKEVFDLVYQMSPYILLGFLFAGLMHAFIPNAIYRKYLGGSSFRTVVNAAILSIPIPLCSCGVIPTAMSLRKEGASKGATVSFLICTPQTGIDSIIATYSLMGLPFALLRPFIAITTAIAGGAIVNRFAGKDEQAATSATEGNHSQADSDHCKADGCHCDTNDNHSHADGASKHSFVKKLGIALNYAFVEMMQDIGKWLMAGLLVAGLITVFVPQSFFELFSDNSLLSMIIILLFALPMYLCATGSIPIAMALMMKGLSPGTALVLLMAGPAINFASMLIIGKVMGRRTMLLYIATIVGGAILFGLGIDYLLPREWFTAPLAHIHAHEHGPSYFNIGSTVLLAALLINAFIRKHRHGSACSCGHDHRHHRHHDNCHYSDKDGHCASLTSETVPSLNIIIGGMMCNHCKANAERAIHAIPGVTAVDIHLASGRTIITGISDPALVRTAVEPLGFTIE